MSIEHPQNKPTSKSFTDLDIWKKKRVLKLKIKGFAKTFPAIEKFRLTGLRGINSAVAEGHSRYTFPDRIHCCIIGRGSLRETYNHPIDAYDCTYITFENLNELRSDIIEVEKLLKRIY
jgi:four helix bundle protein